MDISYMEDFDSKAVLNPENSFPVSHTPEEVSGAVVPPLHTSQRERAEDYGSVIVRLGDRHRVIECSGGIQWIVQRKGGQQWHGLSYHLNRDVLIEHCKRMVQAKTPLPPCKPYRQGTVT